MIGVSVTQVTDQRKARAQKLSRAEHVSQTCLALSNYSSVTRPKHVTISSQFLVSGDPIYHPLPHQYMPYNKPGFLVDHMPQGDGSHLRRLKAHVWEEMSHAYLLARGQWRVVGVLPTAVFSNRRL